MSHLAFIQTGTVRHPMDLLCQYSDSDSEHSDSGEDVLLDSSATAGSLDAALPVPRRALPSALG
jgi:hypothetical protein